MEENITIKVEDLDISGQLKYENDNKSEIFITLPKNKSYYFKNLFDHPEAFNINGKFEDNCEFTAFYSYATQALHTPINSSLVDTLKALRDFHSNDESDILIKYKIDIGKLYLNAPDVNDEMNVKKIDIKFSSIDKWIPNDENKKIFIKQNDCYINISNNFITIESSLVDTLQKLDQIVFDLRVFFEVLVLSNDIKSIKKYIYTADNTKIEEVMCYKSGQLTKENFLFQYDTNSIEDILNCWFEAKNTYGKIFGYLSGILNESSAVYLELKFLMLAQWIEAYSGEKFKDQKKQFEKEEKKLKKNIQQIIKKIENDEDKELVQQYCKFDNEDTFTKKVKFLFDSSILNDIFDFSNHEEELDSFINEIKKYRNNLTHINTKDNLNNTQMLNLYEILKDMIYILLMKELDVTIDDNRINEIKRKYMIYKNLSVSMQKCKDE